MTDSTTSLRRVHMIFKTHLDVGYTDFAANVVRGYFERFIPAAIDLAKRQREQGASDRFVWTTGSWLIYEYLEQAGPAERRRMEEAIECGDIAWHALPFTGHSENFDPQFFRFGLSLSQELDRRYGRRTTAAKMTDVPGHTRGIVGPLAEAGVQFFHIGVNPASTPPDVPDVFRWRDPGGAELMVMYHKGTYGDLMTVPGLDEAIAFAHTGDNLGPQTDEQLRETFREMRERFPGAEVIASTMDAFGEALARVRDTLPVLTQEMGDTWIHGIGTDPKKESQYRELLRFRRESIAAGTPEGDLHAFSRKLLPLPEHTWAMDIKRHLSDYTNYSPADLRAARREPKYVRFEQSFDEQRGYVRDAVAALPQPLRDQAVLRLKALEPSQPDPAAYTPLADPAQPVQFGALTAAIDPARGCLVKLESTEGSDFAGPDNPLGLFWYQTFSAADYERFYQKYIVNKRQTRHWSVPDFLKPGLENTYAESLRFEPRLTFAGTRSTAEGGELLALAEMPAESFTRYGGPRLVSILYRFPLAGRRVEITAQWFDKTASRIPEAAWFSFIPRGLEYRNWEIEKLGQWLSPLDVMRSGARHLHGVQTGARCTGKTRQFTIETLDAPLIAPGQPSLLNFTNRQPDLRGGMHVNLVNNLWGTNFPVWYEDDARFRFVLHW